MYIYAALTRIVLMFSICGKVCTYTMIYFYCQSALVLSLPFLLLKNKLKVNLKRKNFEKGTQTIEILNLYWIFYIKLSFIPIFLNLLKCDSLKLLHVNWYLYLYLKCGEFFTILFYVPLFIWLISDSCDFFRVLIKNTRYIYGFETGL